MKTAQTKAGKLRYIGKLRKLKFYSNRNSIAGRTVLLRPVEKVAKRPKKTIGFSGLAAIEFFVLVWSEFEA
jgi:hypothetical protein